MANITDKIDLFETRLHQREIQLTRNWSIQIGLVALSIYSFYSTEVLGAFAKQVLKVEPETPVLRGIVASLMIYHFMRFGFLAGMFYNLRAACDDLLTELLKNESKERNDILNGLFLSGTFFEPLLPPHQKKDNAASYALMHFVAFLILFTVWSVMAAGHLCVFGHVHLIVDSRELAFGVNVGVMVVLLAFYLLFVFGKVVGFHSAARWTAALAFFLPVLAYFLWYWRVIQQ